MTSKDDIRNYIAKEFLPGDRPDELADDLDLISTGIIDSLGVLKLVAFLERANGLTIGADELEIGNFKSIDSIYSLISEKKKKAESVEHAGSISEKAD